METYGRRLSLVALAALGLSCSRTTALFDGVASERIPASEVGASQQSVPQTAEYSTGTGPIDVAYPSIPSVGGTFVDSSFGTSVTRLSDSASEGVSSVTHFYSAITAFNSDDTFVLTQRSDGVCQVRDLTGAIVRNHLEAYGILPSGNPIWSRTDPDVIYFHSYEGNQIESFDVATQRVTALTTVTGAGEISFGGHSGDVSFDGDHIALVTDGMQAFVYQISTGALSGEVHVQPYWYSPFSDYTSFDYGTFFGITPGGNFFVDLESSAGSGGAVQSFEGAATYLGKAAAFGGHGDSAQDVDGGDAYVLTNSSDPNPIGGCPNGIVKVKTPGQAPSDETCLTPAGLDWNLVPHVSCNNEGQGWCLISTYSTYSPGGAWPAYTNELFIAPLQPNGSRYRFVHSMSSNATYDSYPKASVSHDGRYAIFDSDVAGSTDVYLVAIPQIAGVTVAQPQPQPQPQPQQSAPQLTSFPDFPAIGNISYVTLKGRYWSGNSANSDAFSVSSSDCRIVPKQPYSYDGPDGAYPNDPTRRQLNLAMSNTRSRAPFSCSFQVTRLSDGATVSTAVSGIPVQ